MRRVGTGGLSARATPRSDDADGRPFYRWFPDGRINTCCNALDRHVDAGHGVRTALIPEKILRASMRSLANGDDTPAPATIDDPAVLESLRLVLREEN
ncbi:hypothetical protein [Streptomyces griseofuscus]|uniref:Uncharacterized protein n=1 Tax=Streptomyces griseofuscus TaxID=146922 RepID=A0A3R8QCR9_9ACTN|nr:hypothetical protein [Streptomyces griseofuscus]RRQ86602.1 hypothetical protein CQW44_12180 [Streptomyces griseofuscus]